jgi:predicted metal-dependent enzyme (double-stranded beta helix superfamily)
VSVAVLELDAADRAARELVGVRDGEADRSVRLADVDAMGVDLVERRDLGRPERGEDEDREQQRRTA